MSSTFSQKAFTIFYGIMITRDMVKKKTFAVQCRNIIKVDRECISGYRPIPVGYTVGFTCKLQAGKEMVG